MQPTRSIEALREGLRPPATDDAPYDRDALRAMEGRDDAMAAGTMTGGAGAWSYTVTLDGQTVSGISVSGARHLASTYGGLKHRIVASIEKRGTVQVVRSYPHGAAPMTVTVVRLDDLAEEPDCYSVVVEMTDTKRGLTLQVERAEPRYEMADSALAEREHVQLIAQAKAFRAAVLAILPQEQIARFKALASRVGQAEDLTADTLAVKRTASSGLTLSDLVNAARTSRALFRMAWDLANSESPRDKVPATESPATESPATESPAPESPAMEGQRTPTGTLSELHPLATPQDAAPPRRRRRMPPEAKAAPQPAPSAGEEAGAAEGQHEEPCGFGDAE